MQFMLSVILNMFDDKFWKILNLRSFIQLISFNETYNQNYNYVQLILQISCVIQCLHVFFVCVFFFKLKDIKLTYVCCMVYFNARGDFILIKNVLTDLELACQLTATSPQFVHLCNLYSVSLFPSQQGTQIFLNWFLGVFNFA